MGDDDQSRLLLLDKIGDVIDAILDVDGFLARCDRLSLTLLLSSNLQSLFLLHLGLWPVLVE